MADVAAERDEHAASRRRLRGRRRRGRPRAPSRSRRGRARRPRAARRVEALRVELDCAPAWHPFEPRLEGVAVAGGDEPERPVVAREPERAADGRVDETVRGGRGVERRAQRLEQKRADAHGSARGQGLVRARELAVGSEPAARAVDARQLGLDRGARSVEPHGVGYDDERSGAQRRERRCRGHEPPETTTGGAGVGAGAAGGGAGAGAGAGLDDTVSDARAVAVAADTCTVVRTERCVCGSRSEMGERWATRALFRPGRELAARPANTPASAVAPAAVAAVSRRSRSSAASRAHGSKDRRVPTPSVHHSRMRAE